MTTVIGKRVVLKNLQGEFLIPYTDTGGGSGDVEIDDLTITKNADEEIQTVAVINNRDNQTGIKTWTGTREQFNAIVNKDPNTLYNITDDAEVVSPVNLPIGSLVPSMIPLENAGLHLLDGAVLNGDGIYKDFIDYMADLYDDLQPYKTWQYWYTSLQASGQPEIVNNNGEISGFAGGNSTYRFAIINESFAPGIQPWEIKMAFTPTITAGATANQMLFANGSHYSGVEFILNTAGKLGFGIHPDVESPDGVGVSSTTVLTANHKYYTKIIFTGTHYQLWLSTDDINWNLEGSTPFNNVYMAPMNSPATPLLGIDLSAQTTWGSPFSGSIDLKHCHIKIAGEYIWQGATWQMPCFQPYEGYNYSWKSHYNRFGQTGKFVYDEENNTLRLPLVNGFLEGVTDLTTLGNIVSAGLPEISGTLILGAITANVNGSGVFHDSFVTGSPFQFANGTLGTYNAISFNASKSNAIYGNSTTVQPQATTIFYYVVVANIIRSNVQLSIDNITADLADKADRDFNNVLTTGSIIGGTWALPDKDHFIDLSLPTSGQYLTAPANGWYYFRRQAYANQYIILGTETVTSDASAKFDGDWLSAYVPVTAGETVQLTYTASGAENYWRFYYTKGYN